MPEPAWNHPTNNTSPSISTSLPPEVITCLQNARFLHLSTCDQNTPHISLMNYTYLPSSPYTASPTIIMTTPPSSTKTTNLLRNPRVSLLVHDWVSHRPPTLSSSTPSQDRAASPERAGGGGGGARSSLASLLLGMNTAALGRISTTINGTAQLVAQGSEEERWFKAQHLANNTFTEGGAGARRGSSVGAVDGGGVGMSLFGGGVEEEDGGDGGAGCYIEGDEVRVVLVTIRDGRTADWKGAVKDWVVSEREGVDGVDGVDGGGLVNGVAAEAV